MNFSNAFPNHETQYMSPEVCVIALNNQDVICFSNPEKYITETEEGDDNW